MNHEEVLAVLPDNREEAVSIKEIAKAMGLEISSYVDWVRAERRLVRALGALKKWGWVAYDEKKEGHKFWYNAYWKTELAK
jgi:transcription initiation factor IIE alpha subunit